MTKHRPAAIVFSILSFFAFSQRDSLPVKVSHAEPLYADLVRDLGARRGEHEWNIGTGFSRSRHHSYFSSLVEYEFAPFNRLGFEVEMPFVVSSGLTDSIRANRETSIEGLKLATQFTFFVSRRLGTSMAIGYSHEFELVPFRNYGSKNVFRGSDLKPFLVIAKKWGASFHSMVIAGPEWEISNSENSLPAANLDASLHYVLPKSGHFAGIEINSQWIGGNVVSVLRPQMRLTVSQTVKIGLVSEIPLTGNGRSGFFCRLIWEPKRKLFQK